MAPRTGEPGGDAGAAAGVGQDDRRDAVVAVLVAPLQEGGEGGDEFRSGLGEPVFVPGALARVLVGEPLHEVVGDELVQALGEDGAGDVQVLQQVAEAGDAVEGLAEHEHRPAVADQLDGPGDAAQVPV